MSELEIRIAHTAWYLRRIAFCFALMSLVVLFNHAVIADSAGTTLSDDDPVAMWFVASMVVYFFANIVIRTYPRALPRRERGLFRLMP